MLRSTVGSLVSLLFLLGFLAIIAFTTVAFTGLYSAVGLSGIVIIEAVLFFISWRVGPWISDHIYMWFYGMQWLSYQDFLGKEPAVAKFVKRMCDDEHMPLPRFGYIADDNPQAFTYGSDRGNARMVFTNGILKYLDVDEKKSVFAHETGHIVHRDFIVMTLASFLITLLYVIGRALIKMRSGGGRGGNPLPLIGAVSLVFYYVGTYFLLYLSRTRETYADEYSKEKMGSGNFLATALVKVAYGILTSTDTGRTRELMEGTRTLGIYDHRHAPQFGMAGADYLVDDDSDAIIGSMVYDTHNLWAFFLELSSSHPLTGKRIRHMLEGEKRPVFDVGKVDSFKFDYNRHYREFVTDWTVAHLWMIFAVLTPFIAFVAGIAAILVLPLIVIAAGVGFLIKAFYRFPAGDYAKARVADLMGQVYASPIRGIPAEISGTLVGRGSPGYMFSENMMFQDKTGLLYLDYRSWLPFAGDIYFALQKVGNLIGNAASGQGWFFRGFSQMFVLHTLEAGGKTINSRQRELSIAGALLIMAIGMALPLVWH